MQRDEHHDRRRFWSRVQLVESGCWEWVGGTRSNGYGTFAVRAEGGRWTQTTAHRWAYVDQTGWMIPFGWEVDHLCRNRACVRADHLEAVTLAENRRRRDVKYSPEVDRSPRPVPVIPDPPAPPPKRDVTTTCKNGHLYAEVGKVKNGKAWTCAGCREAQAAKRRKGNAHGTETHCPHGHPYDEVNTYRKPNGSRECRTCIRERNRKASRKAG